MSEPSPRRFRIPQAARILIAIALGIATGLILGERAERLSGLGKVIIDLLRGLAGPLILFAILDAFLRTELKARGGWLMLGISLVNATCALIIGLSLSNWLRPGDALRARFSSLPMPAKADPGVRIQKLDFLEQLVGYVPTNVIRPLLENSMVHIVILTVLAGAALRHVKTAQIGRGETAFRAVEDFVATCYAAMEILLGWVILLIPIAVFGVIASTIGKHGFEALAGLGSYVFVAVLGLGLQVGVVYQLWIKLVSGRTLREFWAGVREPVVYALGASSSVATMPVTLASLARMKVSAPAARLSACIGTNLNNDGILLYEAMAVLCVAQFYGIDLPLDRQILAAAACLVAGIGITGIPDAGLISLLVVLTTVDLPLEIYPLLLSVDWLLSRCRAMTNVTADILVAVLLDRFGVGRKEGADLGEAVTPTGFEPVSRP